MQPLSVFKRSLCVAFNNGRDNFPKEDPVENRGLRECKGKNNNISVGVIPTDHQSDDTAALCANVNSF